MTLTNASAKTLQRAASIEGDLTSVRLLLICADRSGVKLVRQALRGPGYCGRRFELEWLGSCAEALQRLTSSAGNGARRPPCADALLVDLFLPDSQGIETFDRLFAAAPRIPILILSKHDNENCARLAVRHGAQDYLLNDQVNDCLLPKAIGNMIERAANAEALFEQKERAQITLNSIGDAVISTDTLGRVTFLNAVAERLTGWSHQEALGQPLRKIFRIIDASTREPSRNPIRLALQGNAAAALDPDCILIRRDGFESAIEDSASPIHDRSGQITGAVMVFHDVSLQRALNQKMAHLAQHDSLTDLPNRVVLNDRLAQILVMARRRQGQMAMLFLDIDRFKQINDSLGHTVGDHVLQSVANRLLSCVRGSDTVSRLGGDEFVILLSELRQAQDAAIIAEKILLCLSAPHCIDGHNLHVTSSIGVVTYPEDGQDADTLLRNADTAMYRAKASGRGNYQFFKPEMNADILERQTLEFELRRAILQQEFVLHYQPMINLQSGAITGVEALIRWRHPQRGVVPPAQFISIAEDSGLILQISQWVLREAGRQARAWQDAGFGAIRVAMNISAVDLRSRGFVEGVRAAITETGVRPTLLELELTESFLMQDSMSTVAVLRSLKGMGLHLALDDFGTGYSSLSYLKRFPIDTLKINRSFVRDLSTDTEHASIVSAAIGMGRGLHMRVVAEGVETTEQLAFLRNQGCPEGQGYYLGRPMNASAMTGLLAGRVLDCASF